MKTIASERKPLVPAEIGLLSEEQSAPSTGDLRSLSSILLLTPYTGGNLGDAAIQDAVIHHLRKRLFEPQISLVTLSPGATSQLHGLPSFPIASSCHDLNRPDRDRSKESGDSSGQRGNVSQRLKENLRRVPWLYWALSAVSRCVRATGSCPRRARRELSHVVLVYRLLKETDLLVVSGGGQIDDFWGGAFGHPYALFKWTLLARFAKTPVVFPSIGVCSLASRLSRRFAYGALRLAAYRSYRDQGSKQLLREAAFTHADPVYPDLAFSHPCARQQGFSARDADRTHLVVGISPMVYLSPQVWPEQDSKIYGQYLGVLGEFATQALEAGHTIVLFTSASMDQFAVDSLAIMLQQNPNRHLWGDRLRQVKQTTLDNQLNEIRKFDLVVASRLHGVILSHLLGKPVLAVSYDRKVDAHMEAMEQKRFCLNLRDCILAQLQNGFASLAAESGAVSAAIRARVEEFGQELDQQYDRVVQLISHPKRPGINTSNDYPNLDFMRACAVSFVVGFHLLLFFRLSLPGPFDFHELGQWGVLVFFVHTSFVLTLQLQRQSLRAPGERLFWPFLIRRSFRIFPLSIFIICVVEFFRLPVGHLRDGQFVPVHLNAAGLFSNIFLVQNITHAESATAPLWSLPYEMQMYLLLPALFLLVRSTFGSLTIFCLWLAGFVAMRYSSGIARYDIPDLILYAPYFVPGIIAGKWMSASKARLPSGIWPAFLAGLTALYLFRPSDASGAICCLLLGMAIPQFNQISQPLIVRASQLVARYSYGIYLTHFICIWLAFQALHWMPKPGQWAVFLVTALSLPVLLYHLIEAPMIQCGRRVASRLTWLANPSAYRNENPLLSTRHRLGK